MAATYNYCKNPRAGVNCTDSWSTANLTAVTRETSAPVAMPSDAPACIKATKDSTSAYGYMYSPHVTPATDWIPITGGLDYYFGGYYYCADFEGTYRYLAWDLYWYDSSGTACSPVATNAGPNTKTTMADWLLGGYSATAPADAARLRCRWRTGPNTADGVITNGIFFTKVMVVQGTSYPGYFDGASSLGGYTCAWEGTAHNSFSTKTENVFSGLTVTRLLQG